MIDEKKEGIQEQHPSIRIRIKNYDITSRIHFPKYKKYYKKIMKYKTRLH